MAYQEDELFNVLRQLREQVLKASDPSKLRMLVLEINRLLDIIEVRADELERKRPRRP